MAVTDVAPPVVRPAPRGVVHGLAARLVAWDARYRERQHIGRLDAGRLGDCGMTRREAEAEARKPFWTD